MGIIKIGMLFCGIPVRPTTGRERSRKYQRQTNQLLSGQLNALEWISQPSAQEWDGRPPSQPSAQEWDGRPLSQPSAREQDGRPRRPCPACLEFMIEGASTCPHCQTSGITWQISEQSIKSMEHERNQEFVPLKNMPPDKCPQCSRPVATGWGKCSQCR